LDSPSERILITGGAGFSGRLLAERLRQDGNDVAILSRRAGPGCDLNIDLCDFGAVTQVLARIMPNSIVHLAGIAASTHSNIGEIYSANVVGTANLFAALVSAKIEPKIVIIASSAQVYAEPDANVPLTEDALLTPKTHYAVSKYTAEKIAAIYSRYFPIIVTRPFNYTGPGQTTDFLIPKIIQHYAERRSQIRLGNLDVLRDISSVDRVVEAYSRLVLRSIGPTIVNICSGRATCLADIPKIMEEVSGHSVNLIKDPSLFRTDEPQYFVGSPSRLEGLIGPLPNPQLRETLVKMYEAILKRGRSHEGG
jgi:nucleoside-diphosphate-sugar epimerase